ncbi:hypothetical protein FK004_12545 [Flavobacterium kingsejongi]|uniref:Phage tail tape measure protein n=1 Tax=Flavobacterium kingsejongi TaxID=1678728 RepID=A0A2S1LQQ8_9FLAO|nr:hypothetical protein FK004_12545 [Flavobacterium kingsejongi]
MAVETVTVAQGANTVATNIASAAWLRFTAILKANTLGLIIAAIVAAIYYFNKFNESIEEQNRKLKAHQEAVKRDTAEFLKNRDINDKNIISIGKLSDRYEELIKKTNRNTAEQKELNAILDILSKTVPGSTTKMDQYGKALEINTAKTKVYIESKRKLYEIETKEKIKENIANLKEYEKTTRILNVTEEDANGLKLEGIGVITRRNDVLKVQNTVFRLWRDLTNDELKIYLKARIANEENLALTNKNIETLQRRLSVQKQLNDGAGGKVDPDAERTIEVIDGLIKEQEDKIKELSAKSGNRGQEIKAEIAKLKAERDLIYSDKKAGAVDKKETNDRIKRMKELRDALYQLTQFRYQNEIDANQKIIDSDKKNLDERLEAQFNNEQLRQSKSKETLEFELLNYQLDKRDLQKLSKAKQDAFIEDAKVKVRALVDGKVATEKMTSDEKLILEKYYADKKILQEKDLLDRQAINDKEVELVQKKIERLKILEDTKIQKALLVENDIYQQALNLAGKNAELIEQAAEEHEQRMLAIKKRGAMLALKLQIDNLQNELLTNDKKVEADRISAQLREKLENDLVVAKTAFNELGNEKYIVGVEDKIESERAFRDIIIEMSQDLTNSLGDFANALFEKKISNIDDEIAKSDEYYKKLLEAAKGDDSQTKVIEKEQEKRREELEKKKRKEQVKQAIFDKALKIVNIGTATALGIMQAYAQLGPIAGSAAAILVGAIGAVNTAAVLATPIPKYKDGRKNGPKEKAIVGDGGIPEVVERKSGEVFITPATDTLIQLYAGDKVHKSMEDYQKQLQYGAMMANINNQGRMLTDFQASQYFDPGFNEEILKEMRENTKAIKNQKQNVIVNMPKIDIPHEIWKSKNKNWS